MRREVFTHSNSEPWPVERLESKGRSWWKTLQGHTRTIDHQSVAIWSYLGYKIFDKIFDKIFAFCFQLLVCRFHGFHGAISEPLGTSWHVQVPTVFFLGAISSMQFIQRWVSSSQRETSIRVFTKSYQSLHKFTTLKFNKKYMSIMSSLSAVAAEQICLV